MEFKKYQNIMRSFSLLILLFSFQVSFACVDNYNTTERVRIAFFEAKRAGFLGLSPFHYSTDRYFSISYFTDNCFNELRSLNCLDWKEKIGNRVVTDDIYDILYNTKSDEFVSAYKAKSLNLTFKGNTFITNLLLPKNKDLLDCVLFAKKIEYDNWYVPFNSIDIKSYKQKLLNTKDVFLRQRYAFLILKYYYYKQDSKEVVRLYHTYFEKKLNTTLGLLALDYAHTYCKVNFSSSYELTNFLIYSGYSPSIILQDKDVRLTLQTMNLAENSNAKSIDLATMSFRDPGPCLIKIKEIAKLSPNNMLLAFLIGREINKVEDWIYTPQYTNYISTVVYDYLDYEGNEARDFETVKKENYTKDILYLRKLRAFLINMLDRTSGEQKDFVTAAIAQLYFIDNEVNLGEKYTNMISDKANASIQMQKNIQLALASLKQDDLKNKKVQYKLAAYFNSVESLAKHNIELNRCLYSLYLAASDEFSKQGDEAIAGLFFIKAAISKCKNNSEQSEFCLSDYDYVGYFERHAKIKDLDYLIKLKTKQNKSSFEKLICSDAMQNVNLYKDIKGTLAFRENDLDLAYKTFASMPADFWSKTEFFSDYLNEDPSIAKVLKTPENRKFDYVFNKSAFILRLIKLKNQNTFESNLELAHSYFNVSYYGNSWKMISYDRFQVSDGYIEYADSNQKNKEKYQNGNYYDLTIAKKYYEKALKLAKNDEEKALANLMIFECNYYRYEFSGFNSYALDYFPYKYSGFYFDPVYYIFYPFYNYDFGIGKFKGVRELTNFYTVYRSTETFKKYNCPTIENFIN